MWTPLSSVCPTKNTFSLFPGMTFVFINLNKSIKVCFCVMVLLCFQNVRPLVWFLLKSIFIYPFFYPQDRRWQAAASSHLGTDPAQGLWNIDHRAVQSGANFYILFWVDGCQVRSQACWITVIRIDLLNPGKSTLFWFLTRSAWKAWTPDATYAMHGYLNRIEDFTNIYYTTGINV